MNLTEREAIIQIHNMTSAEKIKPPKRLMALEVAISALEKIEAMKKYCSEHDCGECHANGQCFHTFID